MSYYYIRKRYHDTYSGFCATLNNVINVGKLTGKRDFGLKVAANKK